MATSYQSNIPLSALPEIPQQQYPEIYAELLRMRNAIKILQGIVDALAGTGAAAGTKLTKNSANAFDTSWV